MKTLSDLSSYRKPTDEEIVSRLKRELKDESPERLDWHNENGFVVKPFYTKTPEPRATVGIPPYTRGNKRDRNDWLIRQDFEFVPGVGKRILESLQMGVSSIGLTVSEDFTASINEELKDVLADIIHIHFHFTGSPLPFLQTYFQWYSENGFAPEACQGSATVDNPEELFGLIKNGFPHFRYACADSSIYADMGAFSVTEMAIALSALHENLSTLLKAGLTVDEASARLALRMGTGSSYFVEIAKIRAMRELFAEMIQAYSPEHACSQNLFVTSVTSRWNKTIPDLHNNLLRSTTEAMSSIIGGVDEMCVRPFDELTTVESGNGLRWARNIQHILAEESRFNATADPSGGSYYIENLTEKLADAAWKKFKSIESLGGYAECQRNGMIENLVRNDAERAMSDLKEGKKLVVGVNKYVAKSSPVATTEYMRLTSEAESILTAKNKTV